MAVQITQYVTTGQLHVMNVKADIIIVKIALIQNSCLAQTVIVTLMLRNVVVQNVMVEF